MSLSTPVALIIFNRHDTTERIFNAIREAKPKKLFVIADGPRFLEEREKCLKTRAVIERVDWDCEVLTNYSDINLTSPLRCSSGISWVFSQVEEAIILEDDCLPSLSFFHFCQELLKKYRDEPRVMHITGTNYQLGKSRTEASYYFSKYAPSWGWATWRRAWEKFDLKLTSWPESKRTNLLKRFCENQEERSYWEYFFERVYNQQAVHWDYAWQYICWYNKGLVAVSNTNLVSNIGFRADGTHTKSDHVFFANMPISEIKEIIHPSVIERNIEADKFTFLYRYKNDKPTKIQNIKFWVKVRFSMFKALLPESFKEKYRDAWNTAKITVKITLGKIRRQFNRPPFPSLSDKSVNLHLGCGSINHPSFINIDIFPSPHIHYVRAIDNLSLFKTESVDLIYASHCLEHFPFRKVPKVLGEWFRVLKKGGILRLAVPDFDLLLQIYNDNKQNVETIIEPLLGGQGNEFDFHNVVFNQTSLSEILTKIGFGYINLWQPGSSHLTSFNDWSSRPIVVKGKSYPVSLNIEAIK